MNMRLLVLSASIAVFSFSFAHTLADAAPAKRTNATPVTLRAAPLGVRTAACKKDRSVGNLHGTYRPYGSADPQLKSAEGRKMFDECVKLCLDPLPGIYVQKPIIDAGGSWFGKTKAECLGCHAAGAPKRGWAGVNIVPDSLKRPTNQ
jgi:hypothetical protein